MQICVEKGLGGQVNTHEACFPKSLTDTASCVVRYETVLGKPFRKPRSNVFQIDFSCAQII